MSPSVTGLERECFVSVSDATMPTAKGPSGLSLCPLHYISSTALPRLSTVIKMLLAIRGYEGHATKSVMWNLRPPAELNKRA